MRYGHLDERMITRFIEIVLKMRLKTGNRDGRYGGKSLDQSLTAEESPEDVGVVQEDGEHERDVDDAEEVDRLEVAGGGSVVPGESSLQA